MNEQIDGRIDGRIDRRIYGYINIQMDGLDRWMDGYIDR